MVNNQRRFTDAIIGTFKNHDAMTLEQFSKYI